MFSQQNPRYVGWPYADKSNHQYNRYQNIC